MPSADPAAQDCEELLPFRRFESQRLVDPVEIKT